MLRILPILIGIPLLAAYGIADGLMTNRWNISEDLETASARLDRIPLNFGKWQGTEKEIPPNAIEVAEIAGYVLRDYRNLSTGEQLQVLIVCGTPGPTSVHTPDVCYRGAGYSLQSDPVHHREPIKSMSAPVEMFTAVFNKPRSPLAEHLRIFWTWSTKGEWNAPSFPRWHYSGQPVLFKMYVVRPTFGGSVPASDDLSKSFIHEFLPHVNQALFPAVKSKNQTK